MGNLFEMLARELLLLPTRAMLALAAWTLLAQITVATGGSLLRLETLAAVTSASAAIAWGVGARRRRRTRAPAPLDAPRASPEDPSTPSIPRQGVRVALVGGALLVASVFAVTRSMEVVALGALALGGLTVFVRRCDDEDLPMVTTSASRRDAILLLAMALAAVVLALVVHRPDRDDAFYLNVAARAAADPQAPLLVSDGIFGVPDLPLQLPIYRGASIELAVGAVAHLLHVEPVFVAHWGLVALGAMLVVLAHARLFAVMLGARAVVLATFLALVLLITFAQGTHAPGVFALGRLQQGKGWLVGVIVPLLVAAAIEWHRRGDRTAFVRLLATQVAAVGLSSTAIVLAPSVVLVTLLGLGLSRPSRWRRVGVGLLSVTHAAIVLAWLGPATRERIAFVGMDSGADATVAAPSLAFDTLTSVFGPPWAIALVAFVALSAGALVASSRAARAIAALTAIGWGVFLLPPVAVALTAHGLPVEVFVRVTWLAPFLAFAAIAPCAAITRLRAPWRPIAVGGLVLVLYWLGPARVWEGDDTFVAVPTVKAPREAYEAARILVENVPDDARVLAAEDVAPWVSTFRARVHPIYSRFIYQRFLKPVVSEAEIYQRRTLVGYVSYSGSHLDRTDVLCFQSDAYGLTGIVLRRHDARSVRVGEALRDCGFARVGRNDLYDVWARSAAAAP